MTQCWASTVALSCCLLMVRPLGALGQAPSPAERVAHPVVVDSDQCDVVQHEALRELVALELAPRTVRSRHQGQENQAVTHAQVRCSETSARLFVEDPIHGREQELTLDLSNVAVAARSRLLALTLSELIATVDMESTPRPSVTEPRAHEPAAQPTQTSRRALSRVWLGAGIARAGRPRILAPSLQSGLSAVIRQWPLALQSELQLQRGERAVSSGDVVAFTVSGSAGVAGQLQTAWIDLSLGLGLRLGYARLRGETDNREVTGREVAGVWWGPTIAAGAVLPVRTRWGVRGGVDLTYVARDVRGLDGVGAASYSLEGFVVHATLGITLAVPELRIGSP